MKTKGKCQSQSRIQPQKPQTPQVLLLILAGTTTLSLAAPSDLDPTFDPGSVANNHVLTLAIQAEGKILLGGKFTSTGSQSRDWIARLHADGSLDSSFHNSSFIPQSGGFYGISAIVLPAQGGILIGGSFTAIDGQQRNSLARLNADGLLDSTEFRLFDGLSGILQASVFALALQTNGQILAGGFVHSSLGSQPYLGRVNGDGSRDFSFLPDLYAPAGQLKAVHSLAVQRDGKILLGGFFTAINGVARTNFARLNADGSLDDSFQTTLAGFGVNQEPGAACIALQSDGKILIGGLFTTVNGTNRANLVRLNADGSLDTTFLNGLSGPSGTVTGLAFQADGKILVAGTFSSLNGMARTGFARLNPDGSLDESFTVELGWLCSQCPPGIYSLALQKDGKMVLGGGFGAVNQIPRIRVARLLGEYPPPSLLAGPQTQTAEVGETVNFHIRAKGYDLVYQWFFNSSPISGATNCAAHLPGVGPEQIGSYTVVVTNAVGATSSAPAMLSVIPKVDRRPVPGINVAGEAGSLMNVDYVNSISPAPNWTTLDTVSLTSTSQFCFDVTVPLPPQRFYRAWQTGTPSVVPSLDLHLVPAITLTGNISDSLRLDYINAIGPTDAWVTLDTVTLSNMSQLYFDVSTIDQPLRLYRVVPVP